jgi:hypothetical protein
MFILHIDTTTTEDRETIFGGSSYQRSGRVTPIETAKINLGVAICITLRRMVFSGMLRSVTLVRTDVSEERSASFIRVTRNGELVAASVVPSSPILVTLMKEALRFSETSVLTRVTRRNIPEDAIFHSHRRENLKSDMYYTISQFSKKLLQSC